MVFLVGLNVVPLNWAAQAFGLATVGTWLVTGILVTASIGAMLGIEATRASRGRRLVLLIVVALAYAGGLLVLRVAFLMAVAAVPLLTALLQAVLLTAVSAGLMICGAAVIARTQTYGVARAKAAVRHAERAAAKHHPR